MTPSEWCSGGSPRHLSRFRYLPTDGSEITNPSFSSSPWTFGAPASVLYGHPSDQAADLRVDFGPTAKRPERHRQYNRKHCSMSAGFTMISATVHRGQTRRSHIHQRQSRQFGVGRGRLRLKTATCCHCKLLIPFDDRLLTTHRHLSRHAVGNPPNPVREWFECDHPSHAGPRLPNGLGDAEGTHSQAGELVPMELAREQFP